MTASLNVAIVGGGPVCHFVNQFHPTIFQSLRSGSFKDDRSQGGMLDLHRSSGQQAMKRAGLIEEFKKHMRINATELYIPDNASVAHLHHSEEEHDGHGEKGEIVDVERPEIDRRVLPSMLVYALPQESILWGTKLASISKSSDVGNPKFDLHFADGTSAKGFDVVVGADGTWSRVRYRAEALADSATKAPPSTPPNSELICIDALTFDAPKHHPELAAFVGKGSCFATSRSTGLYSQMNGDGSLRTIYGRTGGSRTVPKGPFVKEYLFDWCNISKELVLKSNTEDIPIRPLYEYPPGYTWTSPVSGLTPLGDAAHVITPFTGVGVNLALIDVMDLSFAIEEVMPGSASITDAFKAYEIKVQMYARCSANAVATFHSREVWLGKRGPEGTVLEKEGIENILKMFTEHTYTQPTVVPVSSARSE
ncbi:monooxygenase [Coprinopsis sp. MPI-PUGE-AT-0042]|nr:monooxygenase [Coprinopsis sp. MPI-PUGE-AT-0042]